MFSPVTTKTGTRTTRTPRRCLEGIRILSELCLDGILKESGRCLDGAWRVSDGCLEGFWKVSGKGQVRSGKVRTGQVRPGLLNKYNPTTLLPHNQLIIAKLRLSHSAAGLS